jgi:prevent-host-death family protein
MTEMPVTQGRGILGRLIDQVQRTGEPVHFTRHRRPVAVLIDVETYRRLVQVAESRWDPGGSALTTEELVDGLQKACELLRALADQAAPSRTR